MLINRGIIIHPDEFNEKWLEELKEAELNVLGIHPVGGPKANETLEELLYWHAVPKHREQIKKAEEMGIRIEYEAHALGWIMPRSLFSRQPEWFRMNEKGERTADFNICASNKDALDFISYRAKMLASQLWTGSHRWYFWPDDVSGYSCHCPDCKNLSPSDQALIIANAILKGVRQFDPEGCVPFLAYQDTTAVPLHVEPEDGIFLEFAPIWRDSKRYIADPNCEKNAHEIRNIKELLSFFGTKGSQVLEYWMDNSRFSNWTKPPKYMELEADVMKRDVEYYLGLGFENITSFGCYLGEDYRSLYGQPPILEYGKILNFKF